MAHVTEYTCNSCGLELVDDGRAFVWNEETGRTEDFLILMSTCQKFYGAEITGNVSETYCRECERYVKVYSITEVLEGIDDACDVVMKGIENNIREHGRKLSKLKDIRKRSQYTISEEDGHYVVRIPEYESFHYSNYLFPEMSKGEVIEDALNDFHEQIGGLIESYEGIRDIWTPIILSSTTLTGQWMNLTFQKRLSVLNAAARLTSMLTVSCHARDAAE
ncbi:hypothetical protein [Methanobrevibacter sp.]|uniref:hypothetical protein n=1 Tax=Methanobrevibacter sp. TaxID=66852 RepID=UPI00386E90FF